MQNFQATMKRFTPHLGVILIALCAMLLHIIFCYTLSPSKSVIAFGFIGVLLLVVLYALYCKLRKNDPKELVFLISLITGGVLFCFLFPPGTVPDELHHYESSYAYSNGTPNLTNKELTMRVDDSIFVKEDMDNYIGYERYRALKDDFTLSVEDPSLITITAVKNFDINGNPPQTKIPSALGIFLGKLLGLSALVTFYLGRLCNLIFFIALAYAAVRITPIGKNIFIAISLLPMTLHIAASYSYDAAIMGYAFAFTALCLKCIHEQKQQPPYILVLIAVFGILLAPCKSIYSLILILLFFIPSCSFKDKRIGIGYKSGTIVLAFLFLFMLQAASINGLAASSSGSTTLNTRGAETGHFYGIGDLLQDPSRLLTILLFTFDDKFWFYIYSMVGGSLGWFQPNLIAPFYFPLLLVIVLLISAISQPQDKTNLTPALRVVCFAIFFAIGAGSAASMLLGHTFTTEIVIDGVQGRYLLPALPLLLLALRSKHLTMDRNPKNWIILFFVWFNAIYLLRIFTLALTF